MTFKDAVFGLSVKEISRITRRHPSTVRRYIRANHAPRHIMHMLSLYREGKLPSSDESWSGWRVSGPLLIDPDGNGYTANEIRSLWAVKQLKVELEKLSRTPVQFCMSI